MEPSAAILKIVNGFTGKRVLVAGDLMLDRYWVGEVERISPEAPVPVVRKTAAFGVPGGAANTASNVAALGARAILFGVAGQDEAGTELRILLKKRGVDCSRLWVAPGRPTTVKLRVVAHDQQVVRIDDEDTTPVDAGLGNQAAKRAIRMIEGADAVLVSDYAKGFVTAELVRGLIASAARHGKPIVVDPKGSDYERYRGASVIKPNRKELAVLTGLPVRQHEETVYAGRQLLRLTGASAIVVTEGKDGMTLLQPDAPDEHFPSFAREVYDVTGAGDTALASLAVALAAGAKLSEAVWLANLAAGLAVGESGTVAISAEKVARAIAGLRRGKGSRSTRNEKDTRA
jgi:rfaE bifunctional protein kinase chain/domain